MKYPWILKSGTADEETLRRMAAEFAAQGAALLLAGCTDRYVTGAAGDGEMPAIDYSHLLEMRLFRADCELWAHRTAISRDFSFRIADDHALRDNVKDEAVPFFADAGNYRIERVQRLDIDAEASGNGSLRATGGGRYSLPITDEDTARVVVYLDYDDNGAAQAADVRMKGFERKGGEAR